MQSLGEGSVQRCSSVDGVIILRRIVKSMGLMEIGLCFIGLRVGTR